ncbi:MAG: TetR/AcrR family transcriptional regulator [Candidatus Dormibacteraceae bacterium]
MPRTTSNNARRARPESSGSNRAPWGTISRETVVDAAVNVVSSGGYQDMSIRSLAADLGVAPMTLYRHVDDKDDLLDAVVDRLLARSWRPSVSKNDWRAWITQAADKLRRFLVVQPAALHVYLRHPVVLPTAVARMNAMMDVLRRGMGDEARARRAYAAIHTYTLGFAALEAGRAGWTRGDDDVDGLARELATYTSRRQFAGGLGYLLDGIQG